MLFESTTNPIIMTAYEHLALTVETKRPGQHHCNVFANLKPIIMFSCSSADHQQIIFIWNLTAILKQIRMERYQIDRILEKSKQDKSLFRSQVEEDNLPGLKGSLKKASKKHSFGKTVQLNLYLSSALSQHFHHLLFRPLLFHCSSHANQANCIDLIDAPVNCPRDQHPHYLLLRPVVLWPSSNLAAWPIPRIRFCLAIDFQRLPPVESVVKRKVKQDYLGEGAFSSGLTQKSKLSKLADSNA
ncbi:hypothetical protein Bhyg_05125 [Pseudolycoriella hygida]|uniref:Uncharacterized protein n=1 Tax=Pseudolycoriella hygida TaxID=35572 RepID=A0A9Q0S8Y0_9DIPT|nr:hypothetical protein Bhyg_05125 [Pseudolycoriella hygida]